MKPSMCETRRLGPDHRKLGIAEQPGRLATPKEDASARLSSCTEKSWRPASAVLGPEHPDTLESIDNLGNTLGSEGRYGEAETTGTGCARGQEKSIGRRTS